MSQKQAEFADFIVPLNINGLEGRMLRMPAKGKYKNEILFLYGQHSSIERWAGLAEELSKMGNLTMPDLPGFGGMTSLYKIGKKGNVDNLADYLASFIKLKYRNKKVTVVAMSFSFVIVTRMLQRYPELSKKVSLLVSIVGFAHKDDLTFSRQRLLFYKTLSWLFSFRLTSLIFRYTALQPAAVKFAYHRTHNAKDKFKAVDEADFDKMMDVEVELWHGNDIRTQFNNYREIFKLDNTKIPVALPVHHVAAKKDRYFNNIKVEQHMRRIFMDFTIYHSIAKNHAPTVVATAKEAAPLIPPKLRKLIRQKV